MGSTYNLFEGKRKKKHIGVKKRIYKKNVR